MKKRIISLVGMMLGVVVLAIGSMGLVRAQNNSPKMPSVISTIPVIEVLELRLKDSEQDLPGAIAKIYLRNNSDKTITAFTFEYGNENEDGGGYSSVKISDESGPVAGPKSDFTIDIPAGNFITGTPLRLVAIVFNDGSSAGEDVAASKLRTNVGKALEIKGRRVEPETTVAHTKRSNQPLEMVSIQNAPDRVFTKHDLGNEPIEITSIKTKVGSIKLDEKFQSDGNWLDGLTVEIRNRSKRAISFVNLGIDLRESAGKPFIAGDSLIFGINPRLKESTTDRQLLGPDETAEIRLSPQSLLAIQKLFKGKYQFSDLSIAHLTVMVVVFDDGKRWSGEPVAQHYSAVK